MTLRPCLALWLTLVPGLATAADTPRPTDTRPRIHRRACPPPLSAERAAAELAEANAWIARAGEHPSRADLAAILPRLRRAAYAGNHEAQLRFGNYVVGYYFTDGMFWPREPRIAIPALAMLRVAALAEPASPNALVQALGRTPIQFTDADELPALPKAWIRAALREAKRYLACQGKTP